MGKSVLAKKIMTEHHVPFVSTDALFWMLKKAAPEVRMHEDDGYAKKSERFYPFLREFILTTHYATGDYLIEGDAIHPKEVNQLASEEALKGIDLRSVFLGFSQMSADHLLEHIGHNKWVADKTRLQLEELAEAVVSLSRHFEEECQRYNLKYVDLAGNFSGNLERAQSYLLS